MKKTIILSMLFIVMMAAAVVGYQILTSDYSTETTDQKEETTDGKETESDDRDTDDRDTNDQDTNDQEVDDQDTDNQDTEKDDPEESIQVPVAGTAPAADFTVQDWEGGQVSLSDYYGKPIVVNFWATWCGPCKSELPTFEDAYAEYQDEITFLMVNMTDGYSETVDGTKQFIEENGYSFPVYFDTSYEAYQAYGVTAIPMTLFIDADGKLITSQLGAMSESTFTGYLQEYYGANIGRSPRIK
ncbi:MAG: TlpA family protein disulfide reductase [Lachnospiraceae bacterium]|nr:TlpA family protein disulfide reductase [Lachnospiraceae bacterium]